MEWRYPAASWRPLSRIDGTEPLVNPRGWVLHTTGSDGSPWADREGSPDPDRRFCHLWVSSAGEIQQFQRLDRAARAQGAGDRSWWSVEAEGHADEPLTGHQLDALASWHRWCGARDTIAVRPMDGGIGLHSMGGSGWSGQDCPGAVRSSQRRQIIDRAQTLRELDRARQETWVQGETKPRIDSVDEISTGRAAEWIHIEMMRVRRRLEELEDQLNEMGSR
ncbi:MAG: hypothetical protein QG608_836 [Actinomycetota bacterium]|nr:hypothetical protein [Actinomycetota bacterium]